MTAITDLENEIFLLKEQLTTYLPVPDWGLSTTQSIMFNCLQVDKIARPETIILAVQRIKGMDISLNSIASNWTYIRRKLIKAQAPYAVKTHYGYGWSLIVEGDTWPLLETIPNATGLNVEKIMNIADTFYGDENRILAQWVVGDIGEFKLKLQAAGTWKPTIKNGGNFPLFGVPVIEDNTLPPKSIEARDQNGNVIGERITWSVS